ncbi:MAG: hypothetical protein P9L94_08980 [Candidatus Hinthialibacter antarcticus]|nr:hypothetical protein [Candidatus Hinthialibacter antarcticus]
MNILKEAGLFVFCASFVATVAWGYSWLDAPSQSTEAWVYADISRTNIVAVSGPSQVFFNAPDGSFVLYDWMQDEFFAPRPYQENLEGPKNEQILKVIEGRLRGDIAANVSYSDFTLNWFLEETKKHGNSQGGQSTQTIIEDPRRQIRAIVVWNQLGGIKEYYEESFRKKPRLSIVYYSNGNPRKMKHFNGAGKINGGAYEFHPNGRIHSYSHFFEGVPWGPYLSWDEEGRLLKEDFMMGRNHKPTN